MGRVAERQAAGAAGAARAVAVAEAEERAAEELAEAADGRSQDFATSEASLVHDRRGFSARNRGVRRPSRPLLMILAHFAWAERSHGARPDTDIYEPLDVGMRWESAVELTRPSGRVIYGTAVREITRTETIRGRSYFVSVTHYHGLGTLEPLITFVRKAQDGVYVIEASDPDQVEHRETSLPLAVGQAWSVGTSGRGNFRVEAMEAVTVGGRVYADCLKVVFASEDQSSRGAYYLAPHVGIVLDTAESAGAKFRFTLLSFRDPRRDREASR